ncbi:MAG: thermonuclease family protein [Candidatus Moranbacteria bacterium]|nr:thermonuclease family protein [Candidatus Moranbacteria bacterium]
MSENLAKNNTRLALSWVFGVILSFFGFVGFMASDFISGLVLFLMGVILLPPIGKITETKWNFKLTAVKKAVFLIVGFLIFGLSLGSSNTTEKNVNQASEQKADAEVKSEEKPAESVASPEPAPETDTIKQVENKLYPVKKVVDGDTIQVSIDGKDEVIRLIGINTPETVDPRKPVECFGAEASAKSKEILTGKNVALEADETQSDKDKYGRPLRYVYLEDGTNFNKKMIEDGYAYEYTYDSPYKYQADFKAAQQKAKDEKRGLWAENTCNGELNKSETPTQETQTPSPVPATTTQNTGSLTCAGKTKCAQMSNCQEAKFYLNNCGVTKLDADKDGIPCETICN